MEGSDSADTISEHDLQTVVEQIVNSHDDIVCDSSNAVAESGLGVSADITSDSSHNGARPKTTLTSHTSTTEHNSTLDSQEVVSPGVPPGGEKLKSWKDAGLALKQALSKLQQTTDSPGLCHRSAEPEIAKPSPGQVAAGISSANTSNSTQSCDCDSMNQLLSECTLSTDDVAKKSPSARKHFSQPVEGKRQHCLAVCSRSRMHKGPKRRHRKEETVATESRTEPSLSELTQSLRERLQEINASVFQGIPISPLGRRKNRSSQGIDISSSECDTEGHTMYKASGKHKAMTGSPLSHPNTPNNSIAGSNSMSAQCSSPLGDSICVASNSKVCGAVTGSCDCESLADHQLLLPRLASIDLLPAETSDSDSDNCAALGHSHHRCAGSPKRRRRPSVVKVRRKSSEETRQTGSPSGVTAFEKGHDSSGTDCENCGHKQPRNNWTHVDSTASFADVESMYEEENDASLSHCCRDSEPEKPSAEDEEEEEKETVFEKLSKTLSVGAGTAVSNGLISESDEDPDDRDCQSVGAREGHSDRDIVTEDHSPGQGESAGSAEDDDLGSHLSVEKYRKDKANRRLKMQSLDEEDDIGMDSLDDWDLNWSVAVDSDPDDEHNQPEIKITEAELDSLPEIGSESIGSSEESVDADDEFECDCAMCRLEKNRESSWITEEEEELVGQQEDDNIEYYSDVRDGYDGSFTFNLAELHMPSLLQLNTDILETMFHNVIVQMLAVYPDLLTDGAPPPLTQSAIDSIPCLTVGEDMSESERTCPICLCDFDHTEEVKQLPCHHIFHTLCVQAWLHKSATCPVCRDVLPS